MVIDDRIIVAGSFNYTQPANDYNDENLFVIGSPHREVEGIEVEADPVKDVAVHVRKEIKRQPSSTSARRSFQATRPDKGAE
jgi:phosphatidylserine/phosphatidylglycerophosphate/cardiolipin synthase-like enzyme